VSVEVSDKRSGSLKKDHRADFFVVCKVNVKVHTCTIFADKCTRLAGV
jgi:hypothetical protein